MASEPAPPPRLARTKPLFWSMNFRSPPPKGTLTEVQFAPPSCVRYSLPVVKSLPGMTTQASAASGKKAARYPSSVRPAGLDLSQVVPPSVLRKTLISLTAQPLLASSILNFRMAGETTAADEGVAVGKSAGGVFVARATVGGATVGVLLGRPWGRVEGVGVVPNGSIWTLQGSMASSRKSRAGMCAWRVNFVDIFSSPSVRITGRLRVNSTITR